MFVRYRRLASERVIREHLGLTRSEWDDLSVTEQAWFPEFYKLEREIAMEDAADG